MTSAPLKGEQLSVSETEGLTFLAESFITPLSTPPRLPFQGRQVLMELCKNAKLYNGYPIKLSEIKCVNQ